MKRDDLHDALTVLDPEDAVRVRQARAVIEMKRFIEAQMLNSRLGRIKLVREPVVPRVPVVVALYRRMMHWITTPKPSPFHAANPPAPAPRQ